MKTVICTLAGAGTLTLVAIVNLITCFLMARAPSPPLDLYQRSLWIEGAMIAMAVIMWVGCVMRYVDYRVEQAIAAQSAKAATPAGALTPPQTST
jgi:hypothetical protein